MSEKRSSAGSSSSVTFGACAVGGWKDGLSARFRPAERGSGESTAPTPGAIMYRWWPGALGSIRCTPCLSCRCLDDDTVGTAPHPDSVGCWFQRGGLFMIVSACTARRSSGSGTRESAGACLTLRWVGQDSSKVERMPSSALDVRGFIPPALQTRRRSDNPPIWIAALQGPAENGGFSVPLAGTAREVGPRGSLLESRSRPSKHANRPLISPRSREGRVRVSEVASYVLPLREPARDGARSTQHGAARRPRPRAQRPSAGSRHASQSNESKEGACTIALPDSLDSRLTRTA